MTGLVEFMRSSNKNTKADLRMLGDVYVVADGDRDVNDDNVGVKHENLLPREIFEIQCPGIPSRTRKKTSKNRTGVSVASKGDNLPRRPVDLMCSQFPTDTNSTVGVDVSCGAMNAFSNDVPYNSAGLSLARSVDTNPGGFLSQNTRRRRRPTLISSMPSSPPRSIDDASAVRRRLRTSGINMPRKSRRATFRSSSPGVERFNYAKALLLSDHELEKFSRKIRSEINESELFELAHAAEKAADLGVDNFSGRASTFGGEMHQQRQEELAKTTTGLQITGNWKPLIGDNMPRFSPTKSRQFKGSEIDGNEIDNRGNNTTGFPEQSLLEHARAAAAAVVVATPAVQLRTQSLKHVRKEPKKRSMCIDSLRDVHEVIPQWKELHGHMRTHFYRANVKTNSLFFCETEPSSTLSNSFAARKNSLSSSIIESKEDKTRTDHRRTKSFFDNLAGIKLLPDFRPKQSTQHEVLDSKSYDITNECKASKTKESDIVELGEFGTILSSHISPEKKDFGKILSPCLCVPPGLAYPGECKNYECESLNQVASQQLDSENDRQSEATSLIPRLPRRSESFDLEVLQIAKKMPASSDEPNASHDIEEYDDYDKNVIHNTKKSALGSLTDNEHGYIEAESIVSSPKGKREPSIPSPDYESVCPLSPSNDSNLHQFSPRFAGPSSPTTPSTPNNRVIPRRKDSGFSTPAHLRIIKKLHSSVSDENRSDSNSSLEQLNLENFQGFEPQDETYIATPAGGVYSHFEPNSIVQNSSERSPHILAVPSSLQDVETTHLSLPTIQNSKSENEFHKFSRNFVRRKVRTQWPNGAISAPDSPTTPTDSRSKLLLNKSKERIDFDDEVPCSVEQESSNEANDPEKETTINGSKTLSSSKVISHINPLHDISALQPQQGKPLASRMQANMSENSIRKIQYGKAVDEKKECDSAASNLNHHKDILDLSPLQNEKNIDRLRSGQSSSTDTEDEIIPSQKKTNGDSECSPPSEDGFVLNLRKRIEESKSIPRTKTWEKESAANTTAIETIDSNHTAELKDFLSTKSINRDDGRNYGCDARNGDNLSVCHSLPPTDVSFKAAVQTVQGVAVQTVQGVFSHLSLGSPKNQDQSKEWQSEGDNREFLSNYFYCAKSVKGSKLRRASATQGNTEGFNPLETDGEGLVWTEPCNGRDSPCYFFGIDTMCGGLIDLLPHDVKDSSITANQRKNDRSGVLSQTTTRDRSSSIGMGQINQNPQHSHSVVNTYQHREEGTWLGIFQRVASERLNFQFQTEENDLKKSRHPYTPPCLSRKLPTPNKAL